MCGPQVRFCERCGGASPRAYSTQRRRRERRGGLPIDAAVRSAMVVVQPPLIQDVPCFGQGQEQFPVQ
jgi:hypothetical protein